MKEINDHGRNSDNKEKHSEENLLLIYHKEITRVNHFGGIAFQPFFDAGTHT